MSLKNASGITDYDTNGGHLTEFSQDEVLINRIFSEVNITSFNRAFNEMLESGSMLVLITTPEAEKDKITLTPEKFKATWDEVKALDIKAQASGRILDKILDKEPEGGKIASRKAFQNVDGELVTYSNGVRIFIKKNSVDKNRFLLSARKPGGSVLFDDETMVISEMMGKAILASGFDGISRRELNTFLADKQASVSMNVGGNTFDFAGGGDSEDIETMFQLLYKYITDPYIDENALSAIIKSTENSLVNIEKDKNTLFFREAAETMFNNKYRRGYMLLPDLEAVTSEKLMKMYKDNFLDVNNFVFVISGDVDADLTAELGRKYLGGLAK